MSVPSQSIQPPKKRITIVPHTYTWAFIFEGGDYAMKKCPVRLPATSSLETAGLGLVGAKLFPGALSHPAAGGNFLFQSAPPCPAAWRDDAGCRYGNGLGCHTVQEVVSHLPAPGKLLQTARPAERHAGYLPARGQGSSDGSVPGACLCDAFFTSEGTSREGEPHGYR